MLGPDSKADCYSRRGDVSGTPAISWRLVLRALVHSQHRAVELEFKGARHVEAVLQFPQRILDQPGSQLPEVSEGIELINREVWDQVPLAKGGISGLNPIVKRRGILRQVLRVSE